MIYSNYISNSISSIFFCKSKIYLNFQPFSGVSAAHQLEATCEVGSKIVKVVNNMTWLTKLN